MSNRSKSSTRGNILFSLRVISNNPIRLKRFSNRVLSARGMLPFESFSSQDVFRAFFSLKPNNCDRQTSWNISYHISTHNLIKFFSFSIVFSKFYKNNCNLAFEFHLQLAIFLFRFAKKQKTKIQLEFEFISDFGVHRNTTSLLAQVCNTEIKP